jgi:CheY-like chemotaxis protein
MSKIVLVVEDSPDDSCLLKWAIEASGSRVIFRFVQDGEEAIAYLKGEAPFNNRKAHPFPDLLLLDLSMPKMDGFAVLDWMQSTPACRKVKVIVWSGSEYPVYQERARKAGAAAFIVKPLGGGNLIEVINIISSEVTGNKHGPRKRAHKLSTRSKRPVHL